jgi:hypothetical protein
MARLVHRECNEHRLQRTPLRWPRCLPMAVSKAPSGYRACGRSDGPIPPHDHLTITHLTIEGRRAMFTGVDRS